MPSYDDSLLGFANRVRQRQVDPYNEAQSYQYGSSGLTDFTSTVRAREELVQEPFAVEDTERYTRRPTTMIGKAFDLLSRGEYTAASILHSLTNEDSETVGQVLGLAVSEAISPQHRYTMHDVLRNVAPEFVERRGKTAVALGFAASVALDPLTYLTFGASGIKTGVKGAGIAINIARGKKTGRFFETVAKNLGEDGITKHAEDSAIAGLQHILNPVKFDEGIVEAGAKIANIKAKKFKTLSKAEQTKYDTYRQKTFLESSAEEAKKALDELGYDLGDVIDRGGIKFAGKTLINKESASVIADKVGLTDAVRALGDLPSIKAVRKALDEGGAPIVKDAEGNVRTGATRGAQLATRVLGGALTAGRETREAFLSRFSQTHNIKKAIKDAGLDDGFFEEYVGFRATAEARVISADVQARNLAESLTKGLSKAEREEVTKVLYEAQTASFKERQAYKKLQEGNQFGPPVLPGQQLSMQQFDKATEAEVLERVLSRSNLNDRQRDAIATWSKLSQDMAHLEMDAGLLKNYVANYTSVFHKNFRASPKEYLRQRNALLKGEEPPGLNSSKHRVFATVEHARNAGYEPLTDIAEIAAMRFSMHKKAMEQHFQEKALHTMFGGKSKVPEAIRRDLKRTMGIEVDSNNILDEMNTVVRVFDKVQGWFKSGATVVNPAFSAKQMLGSEAQRIAGGSSLAEMSLRIARGHKHPAAVLHVFDSVMRGKVPKGIVTDFGRVYDQKELTKIMSEYPVFKNMSVEGVISGQGRMGKRLAEKVDANVAWGRIKNGDLPEVKGAIALAKRSTRYVEMPQHVEDINRAATFYDNLMRGFSPEEAYKKMEQVHFNYSSGVTEFEEKFMKRLLPFYQFTKFATVLTANMVGTTPGRAATLTKVQREFMRAYGKFDPMYDGDFDGLESLTPSERHALPGFLFEQPTAFAGFDPELREAVFRIFGGVQFLDVLNIIHFDDDGSFNTEAAKRTLVQGSMAQVTPFIKAPLEAIFKTEFFTGFQRGEDGSGRRDLDADTFFTALSTALGAQFGGGTVATGVAAGALGRMTQELGAYEAAKRLIGWEVAVDPRDGVEKTYINPYMALVTANFLPQFRTALGIAREDLDPAEHVLKNLFGVSTVKLNLQDRRDRALNDATREMRDARARYKRLLASGRKGRAEQAYEDLQQAVQTMQAEYEQLGGMVRGPN